MRKNNKGFSLVELIVAFAISAIAGLAVYGMMSMGSNTFRSSSREVGLQYEQQIVVNQIRDYILESSDAICYDETEKALYVFSQGITDVTDDEGNVTQTESYEITELSFVKESDEAETGEIDYRTVQLTSLSDDYKDKIGDETKKLLGEKIKDIEYDLSKVPEGKVIFTITFLEEDKEIVSTQTVSLRNKIKNLDELDEIYDTTREEVNSFIEGIIIIRNDEELGSTDTIGLYGNTISVKYDAKVVTNRYSTRAYSVSWSATLPNTIEADAVSINPSTGLLTIDCTKLENGDTFKITATSVDDKTKYKDLNITIVTDAVYPVEATLACDTQNYYDGNGFREYNLIPTIRYSGVVQNKTTNILTGDEALDRISVWVNIGDEFPGTKYQIVSGVDKNTGKLRLSYEANGKTFKIYYTLKQRGTDGEVVESNVVELHVEDIPPYQTDEVILVSAPGSNRRGTSLNAMASWKISPGFRVQYFWKIVPYQDNSSAAWSPLAGKNWRTNFDATVQVGSDQSAVYAKKYTGDLSSLGKLGTYVSDGKDESEDNDGNKKTDDDVLTDLTSDNWYTGIDPSRLLKVDIKSYLDWNHDYKAKILLFAYDRQNDVIYDQNGMHKPNPDSLIKPVEKIITIPAVSYTLTPADYVNDEYRYGESKEEYKLFRTSYVLHPTNHWPGERRVFFASTTGIYIESSHSPLRNYSIDNGSRNFQNHYIYYRDKDKVSVKNRRVELAYLNAPNNYADEGNVDGEDYWGDRTQLGFKLNVSKGGQYNQTDFYRYYPNRMEFYSTLYQVNNVTFNGTTQKIYNYVHSDTFDYQIDYTLLVD